MNRNILEIMLYARGGQGAKVAAEIIAQAAASEGKFIQAFPQFGPERSGAPTKTFVRISEKEIRTHEPIIDPDIALVLDETILDSENVAGNLSKKDLLIVNSKKTPEEIRNQVGEFGGKNGNPVFEGKVETVDANGISMEIIGQPRPNTVILGKFVKATDAVKLQSVVREFEKIFLEKIGKEATGKNVMAIKKSYDAA